MNMNRIKFYALLTFAILLMGGLVIAGDTLIRNPITIGTTKIQPIADVAIPVDQATVDYINKNGGTDKIAIEIKQKQIDDTKRLSRGILQQIENYNNPVANKEAYTCLVRVRNDYKPIVSNTRIYPSVTTTLKKI